MSTRLVPWASRASFLGLGVLAIGVLLAAAATFGERLVERTKPVVATPAGLSIDPMPTGSIAGNDEIGRLIEQADAPEPARPGKAAAKAPKAQTIDQLLKK